MIETILKTFTRNIVPGFIFVLFVIYLPMVIVTSGSISTFTDLNVIVLLGITMGFVLDGIGAYRFTWKSKVYQNKKVELAKQLADLQGIGENSSNPDIYIAKIWSRHEKLYDRILEERAEWVSILVSAFCFILAAVVSILAAIVICSSGELSTVVTLVIYSLICLLISVLLSSTGIKRMNSHDVKLIEAASAAREINKDV